MNHENRISKLEGDGDQQPKDIRIDVELYDTVIDENGNRKEMPVPGQQYNEVDWDEIPQQPNGDRIAVRYPRSENLPSGEGKTD